MAENKRIRVSTDTTPLQELRQQGEQVLNTFNQLEDRFKGLATESLDLLRKQIDLIKERNELLNKGNWGGAGANGGGARINPQAPEPPTPEQPKIREVDDIDDGGGNILNSKLGRKIFNVASITAILGVVGMALRHGVGFARDVYQYGVQQDIADNAYQRDIARMESKWMNLLTFGFSGIEAQRVRKGLSRVEENAPTTKAYSQLYGMTYEQAIARQVQDYFDEEDFYETIAENKRNSGRTSTERASVIGTWLFNRLMGPYPTSPNAEKERIEEIKRTALPQELNSRITETLGLSLTDYFKKLADFGRAGVSAENTQAADLYQMMVGQAIRGYSDEMIRQVLGVTRFGVAGTMTGTGVVQALDTSLRQQGYSDQYIASTLEEYVGAFSRFAENMLGKVGRIETDNMIQSMTSIQRATGAEGRQLERFQQAFMGQSVSSDDVTQALLLRTARQINPNLSMFELEAMVENMPNDINLQRQFLQTIQEMAGGGDMLKYTLQAIFPSLSKNDILDIVRGRKDLTTILEQGVTTAEEFDVEKAKGKLTPEEKTAAGTANRQLVEGLREVFGKNGEKFDEILTKMDSIGLSEGSKKILTEAVQEGVEKANIPVNIE